MIVFCIMVHAVMNKLAFVFIEVEVIREGNDELLNSLEEGVIIVEDDCSEVCFLNSAAQHLMTSPNFDVSKASEAETQTDQLFAWDKKILAKIPEGFFTDSYNIDTSTKLQQIDNLSNYTSIKDIV